MCRSVAAPACPSSGCAGTACSAERPGRRIDFLNTDRAWDDINLFAQFFNSATPQGNHADRIRRVAPNGCGLQRQDWVDEQDYQDFGLALRHFADNPGYHIVEMRFAQLVPNHICALHADANGIALFDPNSGEYAVPTGQGAAFLRALAGQYASYVSPRGQAIALTFRNLYFYHIG